MTVKKDREKEYTDFINGMIKLATIKEIVDEFCDLYDLHEDDKFASAVLFAIKGVYDR